jgi:hypothetical protein
MTDVTEITTIRCDWDIPSDDEAVDGRCTTQATYPRRFPPTKEAFDVFQTWWDKGDGRHFCPEHKAIALANLR